MPLTDLNVTRGSFGGYQGFASYWKPSKEELDILNNDGLIELDVLGKNHQPANIQVVAATKKVDENLKFEDIGVTFGELIAHGRNVTPPNQLINGMPWSFLYKGLSVTHETDICYLISHPSGPSRVFELGDTLYIYSDNMIEVKKKS